MKNKPKSVDGWNWGNAISGLLAGAFMSLGVINVMSGKLPREIDLVPLLPFVALGALGCAILAGAAKMEVPDGMVFLKSLVAVARCMIVVLALALSIGLLITGYRYQASHPAPPGWEFGE